MRVAIEGKVRMAKVSSRKGLFHVYILKCADGTYYTGYAKDVKKRLATHNSGKGAKYLKGRGPAEVVYSESHKSLGEALRSEMAIKLLTRHQKEELISSRTGPIYA